MGGHEIACRLSTPNEKVTFEGRVDFYLEEPPQSPQRVGYLAAEGRFVLWHTRLITLAKSFATELPDH